MKRPSESDNGISELAQCRRLLADLRQPNPGRYFADVGASALLGWVCLAAVASANPLPLRLAAFVVGSFSLYRALAFIHELFHQQTLKTLRVFWHVVAGVPLLLPLLLYLPVHQAHHNAQTYGTEADGEYEHFGSRSRFMVSKLLAMNLLIPLALLVRFGLLTPLSFVFPVVRRKVIPAFLHLSIRMPYTAPELSMRYRREGMWVEAACMAFAWAMMGLGFSGRQDLLLIWGGLLITIATLNTLRAAGATHLYVESGSGRDTMGQVLDSTNVDGGTLLTTLLCPAGLQFHALHHMVPYLPYHSLPQAHARLLARLPKDSIYRQSTVTTMAEGWLRVLDAETALSSAPSSVGARAGSSHTWQAPSAGQGAGHVRQTTSEPDHRNRASSGRKDRLRVP